MATFRVLAIGVAAISVLVQARLAVDKPRRTIGGLPATCAGYTDGSECATGIDKYNHLCYWCGLKCTDDPKTCPSCTTYTGNMSACETGIPPFATASNSATCTWCGGSSGTCVDYAYQCAPCASFTSPGVCVTATDPNYSAQSCAWCQGSCKSLLECTPCHVFRSMGECFNNTSPSLPYPFTCEWCNSKCSDNCCAVEDPNTDCTDRVVEAGNGKIGCRWCGNPDELPPTCAPIGSCSN
jgi:hypothetical protein